MEGDLEVKVLTEMMKAAFLSSMTSTGAARVQEASPSQSTDMQALVGALTLAVSGQRKGAYIDNFEGGKHGDPHTWCRKFKLAVERSGWDTDEEQLRRQFKMLMKGPVWAWAVRNVGILNMVSVKEACDLLIRRFAPDLIVRKIALDRLSQQKGEAVQDFAVKFNLA